jgi:arginyl-tRNA synthetase
MQKIVSDCIKNLFDLQLDVQLGIPEEQFGDLSSNIAMQISKRVGKPPREIAEQIAEKLQEIVDVAGVSVAEPGFINIRLSDQKLIEQAQASPALIMSGQTVICEYSDMNAFKTAHAGHLYTTLVGNAVANLMEMAGAKVIRANFGGDVGLHVGKAMWAILKHIENDPSKLMLIPEKQRAAWVTARYVEGNEAYETDESKKAEIIETNKRVYKLHEENDTTTVFAQVYWACRRWSYDGFEQFYESLKLDKQPNGEYFVYYPESTTAPIGAAMVRTGLEQHVFTESDGAVVYDGGSEGLHTRVFLTGEGLPTYETKDLGLASRKWQDYRYDRNIIITASDIGEYMKVVLSALSKLLPETNGKTTHLMHGLVKLVGGQKMSSRKGTVLLPEDVIAAATKATQEAVGKAEQTAVLGAVKYAFLKNRIGGDIVYDPAESVSIHGNSGPYLQYAHARARSIIRKSRHADTVGTIEYSTELKGTERTLVRKLSHYARVVEQAAKELAPHLVCSYLYELAQEFNRFYEQNQVIGSDQEVARVRLVSRYADTLKAGLGLLGIHAPDQM